jgi:two-component system phosphate regulon sensor histidine kinase PhoR
MPYDLWRLAGILLVAAVLGLILGEVAFILLCAMAAYLAWREYHLRRLLRWIQNRKDEEPPDIAGIFEEICREIEQFRDRNKKRKKKLSGFLNQFRKATSALPDTTIVLGPSGEIEWANEAAGNDLGIHWPQDYRQRLTNLVRHPDLARYLNETGPALPSIEIPSPENPDTQLSIRVVPFGSNQRLFVARDVTRLHRLNQVRSDFVANVSHELRTPVTVLSGFLETLTEKKEQCAASWWPVLDQMQAQTARMKNVIDELLMLSRLEQDDNIAKPVIVRVPELLENLTREAQGLNTNRRHGITLEADPALFLRGDENELYSAFSNLVVNAIRYTPEGGQVRIRWFQDHAGAHMEVHDTGIGIPEEHLSRITERFYRVDSSRSRENGGTGLGLAIVKHVLKRHRAQLHIESTVGKGSVFRCDFPADVVVPGKRVAKVKQPV